jgi:hypothetical protein
LLVVLVPSKPDGSSFFFVNGIGISDGTYSSQFVCQFITFILLTTETLVYFFFFYFSTYHIQGTSIVMLDQPLPVLLAYLYGD